MSDTEQTQPAKKSGAKPLVVVGIGCLVLLVLIGVAISYGMKFFAKKAGESLLSGVIENKTGVKTNIEDLEQGKMTFTDTKTGQTVSVGAQELPATFPKDFPVYTNADVAGSVSGSQDGEGNGYLVTFTTKDSMDSVVKFYTTQLSAKGWTTSSSFNTDKLQTWTVAKGSTEGSVSISADGTGTTILVTLGAKAQ